ncbi:hypothetical protein JY96_13290 [Aquabacterium sp. NJ1]|uniref:DUF1631 family protein n=1 Tax=Aquabacterium sp. NJ1 TaxID=1538295 RepID=UPI00052DE79A|nr:DUF1631 family protein [Aquabacterium sp. NJ1]KGM40687.1 hypothetical protein JY96_13290 [Aquabacterium sp. NJ1]
MTVGSHRALALTARVCFLESLAKGVGALVQASLEGARMLSMQSAEATLRQRRQDLVLDLPRATAAWQAEIDKRIHDALRDLRTGRPVSLRPLGNGEPKIDIPLSLVDDSDMDRDLTASRLSQAVSDLTGQEYTDLNARLQAVGGQVELANGQVDVLAPQWLAKGVVEGWLAAGMTIAHWATLQTVLQNEVSHWAQEAYHHANRVLLDHGVRPEIDLRPFIKRTRDSGQPRATAPGGLGGPAPHRGPGVGQPPSGNSGLQPLGQAYDETHMLTETPGMRAPAQQQVVLSKLNQVVSRQVPGFAPTAPVQAPVALSPGLGQAIQAVDQVVRRHAEDQQGQMVSTPAALLQDLQQSKQALKQAASTPVERATIEIVALLFQAILQEERLPAAIRVWFARLQMPVLRVAVSEPDFFATTSHPARVLIDRMGACVMGFVSGAQEHDDALHREIKRIVQVVEAYPDTGRRVFQTVLTEFERFLESYFREHNEASRKGVSLAQQVEQRETYAIQYTIELRKMLEGVPVHEGVREFLFKVWADVLAHNAVQTSQSSDETRALKKAAADLIWSASAKTSREERADVLMRLPPLLKTVREGMARSGVAVEKQDEHIQSLNTALAAAFSARSAALSAAHLKAVTDRLESLSDVLPDIGEVELDEQTLRDLSGHESDNLEIVAEGGTMPTPAMMGWARDLQVGAWFKLDYRGHTESVQLAWQGLQKQLILFVSPNGRGVLFQLHRLAAFLQAGLLVPVEDEPLTTRATREALAKLDADPARLLS